MCVFFFNIYINKRNRKKGGEKINKLERVEEIDRIILRKHFDRDICHLLFSILFFRYRRKYGVVFNCVPQIEMLLSFRRTRNHIRLIGRVREEGLCKQKVSRGRGKRTYI